MNRLLLQVALRMPSMRHPFQLYLTKLMMMSPDKVLILLQAIVAESADGEALDVELAASGFGQHYQEVNTFLALFLTASCTGSLQRLLIVLSEVLL